MNNHTAFFAQIRDLIARDEMDTALQQLRALLDNSPKLDEILLQSARFQGILKQIRLGLVSHAKANLTQNQIRAGLLDLLSEMEENIGRASNPSDVENTSLRAEVERAISIVNSKNVLNQSNITAGGNVNIGDHREEHHHHYGGQPESKPRSNWLKMAAAATTVIGLLAGIAEFSGYSLRDFFIQKPVTQPRAEPVKNDSLPKPAPPKPADDEKPRPAVQKAAPRNQFDSHDSSKQINIPDNQGTININQ
jgi:hypothetical protein